MRFLLRLFPYVRQLEAELADERMKHAACGVIALGYQFEIDERYMSASMKDVFKLRNDYERETHTWKEFDEHPDQAWRRRAA